MGKDILTVKFLDELRPGLFDWGITEDSPAGINLAGTGNKIKWVAVRGDIHDWAIYTDNPFTPKSSFAEVVRLGDKVHKEEYIKKLVPCDDESFKLYRH